MLPNRIKLSKRATDKLRNMKQATGLTPNILARVAIMLSLRDKEKLDNTGVSDADGQELNKSVLFGDHMDVYDVMINQYVYEHSIDQPLQITISALIEAGVHKMGHIKNLLDLSNLVQHEVE